jgi:two-component system, cell cycle response regulator DivK
MVLKRSPQNNPHDDSHPLVLAVNDYADNLELLTCVLETIGCESISAYHGRNAIEMAFSSDLETTQKQEKLQ